MLEFNRGFKILNNMSDMTVAVAAASGNLKHISIDSQDVLLPDTARPGNNIPEWIGVAKV